MSKNSMDSVERVKQILVYIPDKHLEEVISIFEEQQTEIKVLKGLNKDLENTFETNEWLLEENIKLKEKEEQAGKERLKAYHDGYKQGRFDAEADAICEPVGFSEDDALSKLMGPLQED